MVSCLDLYYGPVNDYRMHLRTCATGNKYVDIDIFDAGGKLRFMNHACRPCAKFYEVQTAQRLTMVSATVWDGFPGEEITVS
ncbi:LOW QUALITY PROTEIN: Hypothetical protein PHPALM_17661 [Phytophthora palmivora]|uniref:SET domain-containing protein n=1 Tax=Phytophthora palmivora TaxID=4796 RepID=A0A2P4XLR3_9STRA|nr:LOW QUALITY PROTEIN: Hypothetical protein PHPALM_17661 [Phytophthora palmivora]